MLCVLTLSKKTTNLQSLLLTPRLHMSHVWLQGVIKVFSLGSEEFFLFYIIFDYFTTGFYAGLDFFIKFLSVESGESIFMTVRQIGWIKKSVWPNWSLSDNIWNSMESCSLVVEGKSSRANWTKILERRKDHLRLLLGDFDSSIQQDQLFEIFQLFILQLKRHFINR